ncbi:MAG TPA: DUF1328 domain-containing protein [Opitutaceae bacterium]
MLRWSILFLIVAITAGILGFMTLAGVAATIAKILFFLFVALLIVAALASVFRGKPPPA